MEPVPHPLGEPHRIVRGHRCVTPPDIDVLSCPAVARRARGFISVFVESGPSGRAWGLTTSMVVYCAE
jgi:hypothetical protein